MYGVTLIVPTNSASLLALIVNAGQSDVECDPTSIACRVENGAAALRAWIVPVLFLGVATLLTASAMHHQGHDRA